MPSVSLAQFQGAVIGGAIGDAMGAPVEFHSMARIYEQYGQQGVTDYVQYREVNGLRFAPYSDDTQMAEAVIRGLLSSHDEIDDAMQVIAQNFIDWEAHPQGGHRAPGGACLEGCRRLARGMAWHEAGSPGAGGCGSVMRAYPFGLFFYEDLDKAVEWAAAHSKLTHGAPIALAACASMAVATSMALAHQPVDAILAKMVEVAARYSSETAYMLSKASETPAAGEKSIKAWYEGWAAHEAVAIAAYLFKHYHHSPKEAILAAVNSPGDSDSIGALVGSLVGAYRGIDVFPAGWVEHLERSQELKLLATDIYMTCEHPDKQEQF